MPRLAIVISALGSPESLEGTLVSVLENRPADCEILVALSGPYADPYDLKDEVRFIPHQRGASSVAAIVRALATTRAPFVHLVASGCQVSEGWADAALARFGDRQLGSVVPLARDAREPERIFAAGVGYRRHGRRFLVAQGREDVDAESRQQIVGPCGFAAFYRKTALEAVGGLSTRLTWRQADADVALMLRRAGFTTALETRAVVHATAEADPQLLGFRQALGEERLFWRNLPPTGRTAALAAHAASVTLELAAAFGRPRMISQLCGRMLACLEFGSHLRHHRRLDALEARRARPAAESLRIDSLHGAPARNDSSRARVA